jgi:CRISPR/Cas system-associated protein Csm6
MADIRVNVADAFMDPLRRLLGLKSNAEVVQEALTLLNWAAEEKERGRLILSSDVNGERFERLAMRSLSVIGASESAKTSARESEGWQPR